jgi:hypothetical protein
MLSTFLHRRWLTYGTLVFAVLVLARPALSPAQELARRLILKDGSYQLVTKYEVKGNRVRYLSAERNDWEELPESLVDWPATEKFEKDRASGASVPEAAQLDQELEQERNREDAQLPQVAPGLRLPEDAGVFLLDSFQGEPQIVEIQQTAGDINLKQTIELEGAHAPMQSHVDVPSLYIKLDEIPNETGPPAGTKDSTQASPSTNHAQPSQPSATPPDRFRIVRTELKGGKRIVGEFKRQVTGKVSQQQQLVKTTTTRVSGGWLKLTPTDSLAPGEYVLVETVRQEGNPGKEGMNLYVWDFGVNPKAPANANPWKPDAKVAPPSPPKSDH